MDEILSVFEVYDCEGKFQALFLKHDHAAEYAQRLDLCYITTVIRSGVNGRPMGPVKRTGHEHHHAESMTG